MRLKRAAPTDLRIRLCPGREVPLYFLSVLAAPSVISNLTFSRRLLFDSS